MTHFVPTKGRGDNEEEGKGGGKGAESALTSHPIPSSCRRPPSPPFDPVSISIHPSFPYLTCRSVTSTRGTREVPGFPSRQQISYETTGICFESKGILCTSHLNGHLSARNKCSGMPEAEETFLSTLLCPPFARPSVPFRATYLPHHQDRPLSSSPHRASSRCPCHR